MDKCCDLIRQEISNKYVECSKARSDKMHDRMIIKSLLDAKTLTYDKYVKLQEKIEQLGKEIEELSIQLDVWDKAREVCLNIIDNFPTDKNGVKQ